MPLTNLEHRWNVAATNAGFAGSEYINDPEFTFARVTAMLQDLHETKKRAIKAEKALANLVGVNQPTTNKEKR